MIIYRVGFPLEESRQGHGVVTFTEDTPDVPADGTPSVDWLAPQGTILAGSFLDFMPGHNLARLCSMQLKTSIDSFGLPKGYIQWLPVSVSNQEETKPYCALHFAQPIDVLDPVRTIRTSAGDIVKPAFDPGKISNLPVFTVPGTRTWKFFVNEVAKLVLEKSALSGMVFSVHSK